MKNIQLVLWILSALLVSSCVPVRGTFTPMPTQIPNTPTMVFAAQTEAFRSMNMIKIDAPSLMNNMIGESLERTIYVYLPPSYGSSERRYPVVYYLPGYRDSSIIGFRLPNDMDSLIENGQINEMLIVVANGNNKLGGSFYVNSPLTGNWEDFIVKDVVSYVDSHFRTLPQPESRGITGHSMGGFGALNIAMHNPDVFGAVYSMSPGLFDENGLSESQMFARETLITSFLAYEAGLASLSVEEATKKMLSSPDQFTLAYGFAFAPNPDRHPPYFDYPYADLEGDVVRDETIWKKWESGLGGIADEAVLYKEHWLKLKGIVVDYGTFDEYGWIPKGCVYFGEQLSAVGIPVTVVGYDGTHQSGLGKRVSGHMLPFFSTLLAFE
jgi:S-formylglutathione hydrolase